MKVVTDQNVPSSVGADSASQGQMCEAAFWAICETNGCSQWCNNYRVMRPFSKSEWILDSNCVPDLTDHPQVKSPILWQRAPLRDKIHIHINHCCDTNSSQMCDYHNTQSAVCMAGEAK